MSLTLDISNLNEQQILMLRLLTKPLHDADFARVRRFILKLIAQQIDNTIREWEQENDVNEKTNKQLSKGHFCSRPSKKPE